jgi:MoxR-like ATPase
MNGTNGSIPETFERLIGELQKAIVGQRAVMEQAIVAFLAGGHVLVEGVPGLAKTLFAKALAHTLSSTFKRIQFTPDLMPSDIIGTNVFDLQAKTFSFVAGPIFADIVLVDEINRTPPKTQAALLEAMEERQVTVDGVLHALPSNFFVVATQNPVEYEGTFPLAEAQVDRFLMKISIHYPEAEEEREILRRYHAGSRLHSLQQLGVQTVMNAESIDTARKSGEAVVVKKELIHYIVQIVAATRASQRLSLGASPRASLALLQSAKVLAALRGRDFVTPDDVKELAPPVLRHRLILRPEAEIEGHTADSVVAQVLGEVPVPR